MIKVLHLILFFSSWQKISDYYLNNVKTIYAEFTEILISDEDRREFEGALWANREGYLRFSITKPDSQILFVRKDRVFIYDFEEKKESEIFSSPYLPEFFLLNFENFYNLKEGKIKADTSIYIFERRDSSLVYDTIEVLMEDKNKKPFRLNIISKDLSVKYIIIFKNFVINPIISKDIFFKVQVHQRK
ncbi:MAG: outer-membrane lipoprotein carrier protein LolA [Candidatus Hydrothermales bacterium]